MADITMNILFIILASLGFGVIFLGVMYSNAYGYDYFELPFGSWYQEPFFCLVEIPSEHRYIFMKGVTSWRDKLPDNLSYSFKETDRYNLEGCQIRLVYDDPTLYGGKDTSAGNTKCLYKILETVEWLEVVVKDRIMSDCIAAIKPVSADLYNTVVHETGHTLGLGHRQPYETVAFLGVINQGDVMFFQSGGIQAISDISIEILKELYGGNGWERPNNSAVNETKINHEDSLRD